MIVTNDNISEALAYLAETDGEAARLYGRLKGLEDMSKTIYGMCFLQSVAKNVEERKAKASTHRDYQLHLDKIIEARCEYETIRLHRATQERMISVWQSEGANRRAGAVF